MHISKKQSTLLAIFVVATFFIVGGILLRKDNQLRNASDAENDMPELLPAPEQKEADPEAGAALFSLDNFHRSETRGGQKRWEIKAKSGLYSPLKQEAKLEDARLWVYKKNRDPIKLKAKRAVIFFDKTSLKKALLSDGVTLTLNDGVTIRSNKAELDQENGAIFAPGKVTIYNKGFKLTGEELHADINAKTFVLSKNVKTTISPSDKEDKKEK